ncbi:MAG: SDR family NAD(P)-dependent oxidoreductase [Paracoccaceae bacterium]
MVDSGLFDLTGKVVLVTGASRGIGRAMAQAMAQHGAEVVVSSRKQDQCEAACAAINEVCGATRAHPIAAHAGRQEELAQLVDRTRTSVGPIDVVLGNAAVNPHYGPISEIPDSAYEKIMATNVQANLWLARLVVGDMAAKGAGSLIFTSSIGAFKASPTLGTYGMSKLALIGLVRNLAQEFGPSGVRANAICPGLIKTDFAKALWEDSSVERRVSEDTPLRRLGEPDDLAGAAVFLASDASRYVTGQALTVCGGVSMWS